MDDSIGQEEAVASVLVEMTELSLVEEMMEEPVVLGCSIWLVELSVTKLEELSVAEGTFNVSVLLAIDDSSVVDELLDDDDEVVADNV